MLGIRSFLQGVYKMLTKLTKKNYRSCAIVMAGTVAIAVIAFNSTSFGGSGKNKTTTLRNVLTSEDDSDEEETDTQAKIQAGIEEVLSTIENSAEFSKNQNIICSVMSHEAAEENIEVNTSETVPKIELSSTDYNALLRIVEAEATGEDLKGKILVGNVIMNRVSSDQFPDTVEEVILQKVEGHVQFSPTADGRYQNVQITDETVEAVDHVLAGEDYSQGALFFSARDKADPDNMSWFDNNLKWLFIYGGHEFYTLY
ncbi:N-acetylmuramoyl-L-alanine amidase [Lachnotalea glycerini]|uniref:N-acetylmuramoyl-L-alanine amidase n=2 Tax=Lachnotalea glycerini TaxID=1763509 RepID=A0A318EQZ4_9FIRM|nr:cell wall hydrolase [Lachnotalea glycerini]PXV95399.1 N-acetylmuramoyl-L-alanine amidase [Lachnotalea glycerini]